MKDKTATVTIDALSHEGRGIATWNQKKVFVRGALPGETVNIQFSKIHSKYAQASVTEVINAATNRVEAKCPHFGTCGGCLLQHMSTEDQLLLKEKVLLEQLRHFGNVSPKEILAPLKGPTWHYRHKARLGVKYVAAKQKVVIGFREINGRYITDCQTCPILPQNIGSELEKFAILIAELSVFNAVPQLEIAVGDTITAIVLRHLQPLTTDDITKLQQFGKRHEIQIYCQPNGIESITKCWPVDNQPFLTYQNPEFAIQYHFHPTDFTQINPKINLAMVSQAINLLNIDLQDDVLDLFCGLGNFSLPLATKAKHVVGVEGCAKMVARAAKNSQLNHLENTEFFVADLSQFDRHSPWVRNYTKILIDPPRCGAEALVSNIKYLGHPEIVYVSCNPATLARDAGILSQQGYQLAQVGILDMFPHTGHVESMARFYFE